MILPANLFSQDHQDEIYSGYCIVVVDTCLQAGELASFFMGSHWRDLWTAKVKLPILNVSKYAGGLTPTNTGGGLQTKSLHFIGADGKKYKFRSLKKDVNRSLPPDFQNSIIDNIIQDQVSVMNPASSVIIPGLMDAVGILHVTPLLCVMSDSKLLGKFYNDFAGLAGTIEENPDEYDNQKLNFANADKIISTFKLFEKLEDDPDEQVNQAEYLKARLLDIFIGDRDRHAGQWDWAGFKKNTKRIWIPIPKDRDFAFPLYDGLIPKSLTVAITSFVNFDKQMPAMLDMTWEGRHLDRRLLGTLCKETWDSVAVFLQNTLTDSIIENAVRNLPLEYFNIAGKQLISILKSRRDQLKQASDEFYKLIVRYVDLYGSKNDEFLEINRLNDEFTKYDLYKRDNETGEKIFPPIKSGMLLNSVTDELRIHLLDGDDYTMINGNVDDGIRVVVDAGDGKDTLIDSSNVNGYLLHLLPINISLKKTEFYDSGKKTVVIKNSSTYFNNRKFIEPKDPQLKYEPNIEDRYHDYALLIPVEYNTDDGLFIGVGGRINYYDFRQSPFDHKFELAYGYAYQIEKHYIHLLGEFNDLVENTNIKIPFTYSGIEITRFYGFGNESVRNEDSVKQKYYNVNQRLASIQFNIKLPMSDYFGLNFGFAYEYSNIINKEERLLQNIKLYGIGQLNLLKLNSMLRFDNRDDNEMPCSGFLFLFSGNYYPELFNSKSNFGNIELDLRNYQTFNFANEITVAARFIGEKVWGKYPFFKGANLGGKKTFRGFARDRFVGDASFAGEFDLRIMLGKVNFLLPFIIGVNLFTDTGRVFFEGGNSNMWHNSIGGGLWFSIYQKKYNLSFNFAHSVETNRFYITLGQMF